VIDAKGVIRYKNVRGEKLDEALTTLLAEAGHEVQIEHEHVKKKKEKDKEPQQDNEAISFTTLALSGCWSRRAQPTLLAAASSVGFGFF